MKDNLFENMLQDLNVTEKQKAVLRASMELFSQKGFENTSTKDIAKLANVSEGTVYKKYKTKQAILDAIIEPFIKNSIPKLVNSFQEQLISVGNKGLKEYFEELAIDRFTLINENISLLRLIFRSVFAENRAKEVLTQNIFLFLFGDLKNVIKHFQDQGEIEQKPIIDIMHIIIGAYLSYTLPVIYGLENQIDVKHAADNISLFLVKGLRRIE